ncbi:MAG: hypothetical protein LBS57_01570 [Treponema sp.]|jgi:hypothetical protein|nr:hypothetical protein [Treponema sp.]
MGLLSKAAVKTNPVLDEMGKVLRDRILRLPTADNTPETALNLLKAYLSFHRALCLSLSKDSYESYASSGAVTGPVKIPVKKIFSPERDVDFFCAESDGFFSDQGITGRVWVFPLDSEKPWRHVFLLSEEGKPGFNAESTAALLAETGEKLIPSGRPAADGASPRAGDADGGKDVWNLLEKFAGACKAFHGIVLDAKNGTADLTKLVSKMLRYTGEAAALPGGNCLVLVNDSIDRELLAHRLAKNIKTRALLQFGADSAAGALKELKPYL